MSMIQLGLRPTDYWDFVSLPSWFLQDWKLAAGAYNEYRAIMAAHERAKREAAGGY